jgi:hypothetical protein
MEHEIELFITDFLKEIREDNAAVFAGAGFSVDAGFVDWRTLLTPIAEDLKLNIDNETDLVALAQYYCNKYRGHRDRLTDLLIQKMCIVTKPTENHKILARLPINTYWTTNYDNLIETSLREAGKIPDVKYTIPHLATTKPRRDAVIYKMHGDIDHLSEAVLIKDDYEKYHRSHGAFINALSGDLISKTFLFLGFSFTDPNLDYVLSRIRVSFRENSRHHYAILKRCEKGDNDTDENFEYAKTKQSLWIEDLKRFNVETLLVDDYSKITEVLRHIEKQYRKRTIFISGSAAEFGDWGKRKTEEFLRNLASAFVQKGYRIVTGIGLGIGDAIISGATEQIFKEKNGFIEDSLIMRPFPRAISDESDRVKLWRDYREEMISKAGIVLQLFGNKMDGGNIRLADGLKEEFDIANEMGVTVIPIGATGYMAKELWKKINTSFTEYFPNANPDFIRLYNEIGESVDDPNQLISKILTVIEELPEEE